jgi:hypothetical protein
MTFAFGLLVVDRVSQLLLLIRRQVVSLGLVIYRQKPDQGISIEVVVDSAKAAALALGAAVVGPADLSEATRPLDQIASM